MEVAHRANHQTALFAPRAGGVTLGGSGLVQRLDSRAQPRRGLDQTLLNELFISGSGCCSSWATARTRSLIVAKALLGGAILMDHLDTKALGAQTSPSTYIYR